MAGAIASPRRRRNRVPNVRTLSVKVRGRQTPVLPDCGRSSSRSMSLLPREPRHWRAPSGFGRRRGRSRRSPRRSLQSPPAERPGLRRAGCPRIVYPPAPLIAPIMTAAMGVSRNSRAFSVPDTASSARPRASTTVRSGFRNFLDHVEREECGERAQKGRCARSASPCSASGGDLPIKMIAHDAAARRRREGHDDNAKGVQPFHGGDRRALNCQDEGSRDIDGLQQSSMARWACDPSGHNGATPQRASSDMRAQTAKGARAGFSRVITA